MPSPNELTTLKVGGHPFRCACGANVFRVAYPVYTCNGCGATYQGER